MSGTVDFPIYHVDDGIGYIPEPNQSGSFLRTHSWAFNDRSMGTATPWEPARRPNILLIGNSVVMGGNPYDQKDKLGPLVQQNIGSSYAVWPIAAGGWTNVNETVYLKRNPDVAASPRFFVWEYMAGGLSALNTWNGDYVWPRDHAFCASWYVFRRYIWPHIFRADASELPPVGVVDAAYLAEFETAVDSLSRATGNAHSGVLFLYPKEGEFLKAKQGNNWLPERSDVERIAAANHLVVVDVARQPEWNEALYRPDGTHPTTEGNVVLATILTAAIKQSLH
jgi:hypothetical protein